jgi:sec-independent protein translocase protein TatA
MNFVFLFSPGLPEIIIIVLAIILLFGGRKIPELMKGIGKGIREFNAAKNAVRDEIEEGIKSEDAPKKSNSSEVKKED